MAVESPLPSPATPQHYNALAPIKGQLVSPLDAFEIRLVSHSDDHPTLTPGSELLGAVVVKTSGPCPAAKISLSFYGGEIVGNCNDKINDDGYSMDKNSEPGPKSAFAALAFKGTRALRKTYFEENIILWEGSRDINKPEEAHGVAPTDSPTPPEDDSRTADAGDSSDRKDPSTDVTVGNLPRADDDVPDEGNSDDKDGDRPVPEEAAATESHPGDVPLDNDASSITGAELETGMNIFHFAIKVPTVNYPTRMISICDSPHQDFRIEYLLEAKLWGRDGNVMAKAKRECNFQPSVPASRFHSTPYSTIHIINDDDDKPCVVIKASFLQREFICGDRVQGELFFESMRQSRQIVRAESQLRLRINCRLKRTINNNNNSDGGGGGSDSGNGCMKDSSSRSMSVGSFSAIPSPTAAAASSYRDSPDVLWTRTIDLEEPQILSLEAANDTKLTAHPKPHINTHSSFRALTHKRSLFSIRTGHKSCRGVLDTQLSDALAIIPSYFLEFTYELFITVHLSGIQSSSTATMSIPLTVATERPAESTEAPGYNGSAAALSGTNRYSYGSAASSSSVRKSLVTSLDSVRRISQRSDVAEGECPTKEKRDSLRSDMMHINPNAIELLRCNSLGLSMKPMLVSSDDPSAFLCHPRLSAMLVNQNNPSASKHPSMISSMSHGNANGGFDAHDSGRNPRQTQQSSHSIMLINNKQFNSPHKRRSISLKSVSDASGQADDQESKASFDGTSKRLSGAKLKYISAVLAKGRLSSQSLHPHLDKPSSSTLDPVPEDEEVAAASTSAASPPYVELAYISDSEAHLIASEMSAKSFVADIDELASGNGEQNFAINSDSGAGLTDDYSHSNGANSGGAFVNDKAKVPITPSSPGLSPGPVRPAAASSNKMELDVDFAFDSDEFNTIFSGDNILLSFNKLSSPEPPTPTSSSMQKATEPTQQEDRKKGKDAERPTTTDELSERVVAPSNAQDLSTARDEPTPSSNQVVSAIIAPVSIAHVADHQDSSDNKENNPETKATHTITSKISFSHNNLLDDMLKLDTKWCELPSTSPDSKEPTAPTSHPRPMDPLLSSSSSSQMVRKGSPLSLIRNGYLSSKIRGSMPALSTGSSVTTAAATAAAVAVSAVKSTSSTTDNNSNLGGEKSRDSGSRASLPFAKLSDIGKRISRWMVKRS